MSTRVLRVFGQGPYLPTYSYDIRGPLRVMNFTSQDLEALSDREEEISVDVPDTMEGEQEQEQEHDSDVTTESTNRRNRSICFIDPDLSGRSRSHSSPIPKPGDERRRFEEIMEARNRKASILTDLASVKNTVKQWCIKQFDSVQQAFCRDEEDKVEKAKAGATQASQGSATAETNSPRYCLPDEATPHFNDTASTASTQPDNDSDIDLYRLERVHAHPH